MTRKITLLAVACAWTALASSPGEDLWQEGLRQFAAEDFRQAQDVFQQAVEEDPRSSKYALWLALAMGRRAENMSGLRKLTSAPSLVRRMRRELERAIELDRSNLDAYDALQVFHLQAPSIVGGSKDRAREIADQIQKLDSARGAGALAAYYEDLGEFERAGEQYALARQLDPDGIRHILSHAAFLSRRGAFTESDELFELAFALDPDNPKVWRSAGTAWVLAKRESLYSRARRLIERYLETPDREPNPDPKSEVRKLLKKL